MSDFRDLVGDDLTPEEEARLGRMHDLLLRAGPPPELPPALASLEPPSGEIKVLPHLPRRRWAAAAVVAAAVAAIAFGAGYLVADDNGGTAFPTDRLIAMHPPSGAGPARGSIAIGSVDEAGNWPLLVRVSNLPKQPEGRYYELWLTRGKRRLSCGTFRMTGKTTTVWLNAPYKLKDVGWVVTADRTHQALLTT